MNLYLSSYRIGEAGGKLSELSGPGEAYVIPNALDWSHDTQRRQAQIDREIHDLAALGIFAVPLDLRDFFGKPSLLSQKLSKAAMLWVMGGNTFLLRKAMALSGLDEFLYARKGDSSFLYAGYSAGVCVLCPSLEGIHLADEPEAQADGYHDEVMWSGLGLIDYYFVPHFRCGHFESDMMEVVVDYYQSRNLPFRTLADGEVLIESTHASEQTRL